MCMRSCVREYVRACVRVYMCEEIKINIRMLSEFLTIRFKAASIVYCVFSSRISYYAG